MKIPLETTSNGLAFTLETDPPPVGWSRYRHRDFGPSIAVNDGAFVVCSYYLETLAEHPERGVCVTSGLYETYRSIDADDLVRLVAEARAAYQDYSARKLLH